MRHCLTKLCFPLPMSCSLKDLLSVKHIFRCDSVTKCGYAISQKTAQACTSCASNVKQRTQKTKTLPLKLSIILPGNSIQQSDTSKNGICSRRPLVPIGVHMVIVGSKSVIRLIQMMISFCFNRSLSCKHVYYQLQLVTLNCVYIHAHVCPD